MLSVNYPPDIQADEIWVLPPVHFRGLKKAFHCIPGASTIDQNHFHMPDMDSATRNPPEMRNKLSLARFWGLILILEFDLSLQVTNVDFSRMMYGFR